MKLKFSVVLGVTLVSGCASKPAPVLPYAGYQSFAHHWVLIDKCASTGYLEPVLAAYGKKRMQQELASFTHYPDTLNQEIQVAATNPSLVATQETCSPLAVEIAGLRDEYDRNVRASQNSGSQYTSCYSGAIGTNCYSY